jgi:hypothetical protein
VRRRGSFARLAFTEEEEAQRIVAEFEAKLSLSEPEAAL